MTRVADVFKSLKSRGSCWLCPKSLPTYVFWSSEGHMVESRPTAWCLVNFFSDVNGNSIDSIWAAFVGGYQTKVVDMAVSLVRTNIQRVAWCATSNG